MKKIFEKIMAPKSGLAIEVKDNQYLRVIDLEGQQVVDMAVFNLHNPREKLSTSWSRERKLPGRKGEYRPSDRLVEGDILRSTLGKPMMTIVKETQQSKGTHDTHGRFCNRWNYEVVRAVDSRDGCHEILAKTVASYNIPPEDIPDTFDIHMNYVHIPAEHRWEIREPLSRAGDYVEFRAEMDCLVALSNCPADIGPCNAGRCKPVEVEIYVEEWPKPD